MDSVQVWQVLKQLKEDDLLAPEAEEYAWHEVGKPKTPAYPSVGNQMQILDQLQALGAIKIQRRGFPTKNPTFVIALQDALSTRTKGVWFQKLSPRFDEVYAEHSQYEGNAANATPVQLWLTQDDKNNYLFDGNRVHFPSPNAAYIKIFHAVYSLIPQGGNVSYERIREVCGANKDAVQRALTGKDANFFRYVVTVKRIPKFGIPLFEASKDGKELIFNNKQ